MTTKTPKNPHRNQSFWAYVWSQDRDRMVLGFALCMLASSGFVGSLSALMRGPGSLDFWLMPVLAFFGALGLKLAIDVFSGRFCLPSLSEPKPISRDQVLEEAARVADEFEVVNRQLAEDALLLDPAVQGKPKTSENVSRHNECQIDRTIHGSIAIGARNISGAIRAMQGIQKENGMTRVVSNPPPPPSYVVTCEKCGKHLMSDRAYGVACDDPECPLGCGPERAGMS